MPVNKIKCNRKEKAYKRIICDLLVIHRNKGSNSGRPPKISNEFIVNRIFLVLLRGQTWKEVEVEGLCEESVIRKKYNMMVKEGIIDAAHKILFDKYKSHRRLKFLHIDSACIQNVNNSEIVDYYYKIQSKKQLKLTIVSDLNLIPLSYHISQPKINDSAAIPMVVKNLDPNILAKNVDLGGDKGYQTIKKVYHKKNKAGETITLNVYASRKRKQIVNRNVKIRKINLYAKFANQMH